MGQPASPGSSPWATGEPMPGAPPPHPSSVTLVSAELFLTLSLFSSHFLCNTLHLLSTFSLGHQWSVQHRVDPASSRQAARISFECNTRAPAHSKHIDYSCWTSLLYRHSNPKYLWTSTCIMHVYYKYHSIYYYTYVHFIMYVHKAGHLYNEYVRSKTELCPCDRYGWHCWLFQVLRYFMDHILE